MNNPKRHLLALALLPLALGGTLAACGDSNPSTATAPPATSTGGGVVSHDEASPSDVDKAFVRQMIPHHQGAVTMAKMAQENGQHAEVKTLAGNIISSQTTEIDELKQIASQLGVKPETSNGGSMGGASMPADAATLGLAMDQMGMSMDMGSLESAKPFDRAFINDMIPHHTGAIAMAKAQLTRGTNPQLKTLSKAIISAQEKEIKEMKAWQAAWYGTDAGTTSHSEGGHSDMPGM